MANAIDAARQLYLIAVCHLMAASFNDREDEALAIDDIVTGMRRVIDQLSATERKLVLTSIRSKWSDIADRLEAPSSRNH